MDNTDSPIPAPAPSSENNPHLTDATIMMVDDESTTMEMIQIFLEDFGYTDFVQVEKSTEAMRVLRETKPDILLLDLNMPEVTGFDILDAVRKDPQFCHLPVIILTAASDPASKLQALDGGATDLLAKPVDPSELGLRVRNTLAAKAYLDRLSFYDPLTNLPNRHLFLDHFNNALNEANRHQDQLALLNIQLDKFNSINNTMGQKVGDEILLQVAGRIEKSVRESDLVARSTADKDSQIDLFRMEGCVFYLSLSRLRSEEDAAIVAGRIIEAIREPIIVEGTDVYVTSSIGIATYPAESDSCESLLRVASNAKDYIKNKGGDGFQFSNEAINTLYTTRQRMELKLRTALEKDQFILYYQPQVNVATGVVDGVEALIRMQDGNGGLVPPFEFIPVAEETGLIVPIGTWVIREACRQLKAWAQAGKKPVNMSVNLSAIQFEQDDIVDLVKQIVTEIGIDPQYLTLEITESLLMDDIEIAIGKLHQFKKMGHKISIDDFGTGYSSLSYLQKLPIDELKVDKAFIDDLAGDKDSRAIASTVVYLSKQLGLLTVAEGVEDEHQLKILQEMGCDLYQGFYFSRPVPGNDIFPLLLSEG